MTTPTTATILRHAKALISDPAHWIVGQFARDDAGRSQYFDAPMATCFCMVGAILRAKYELIEGYDKLNGNWRDEPEIAPLDACVSPVVKERYAIELLDADAIPFINDAEQTTHNEVMAYFDCAIARAEKEAP